MSQEERIRVAIVGAGVVGLTLAVAINAFDRNKRITIDMYEATPKLEEIGAGINVWPKTWEIFQQLGVGGALVPFFDHAPDLEPRLIFQIWKGDQENGFRIYDAMNNGGPLRIHRADLQQVLIDHLPLPGSKATAINSPCALHLGHRFVNYTYSELASPGPVTLHFSNKTSVTCDIMIAADGVKAHSRRLFLTRLPNAPAYEKYVDNLWSGTVAYRGLVPREELEKIHPGHQALEVSGLSFIGRNKYLTIYPVSGGKTINVVAIVREAPEGTRWEGPWKVEVPQTKLLGLYAGWDKQVLSLLSCIKKPTKWALFQLDHLDIFARGRVFLAGDAAHAMLPHLGAGATVGIEDAYILAALLTQSSQLSGTSTKYMERIAGIYNTIRVPPAIAMSKGSTENGYFCSLETPELESYREGDEIPMDLLLRVARATEKNFSWTTDDPNEDRHRAIQLLVEREKSAKL